VITSLALGPDAIFCFHFLFTCHVSSSCLLAIFIPIFHFIPTSTFISSMKHSKHFPNSNWYLDVQEIFKYVVNVFKQLCEQSKYVYILTNVCYEYWNYKLHILELFNLLHFSPYETHVVRLMSWWISLWTSSILVQCFHG